MAGKVRIQALKGGGGQYRHDHRGMELERQFQINSVTTITPPHDKVIITVAAATFSHCVNLKRFHALSKVCSDRDDTAPLNTHQNKLLQYGTCMCRL